jgi:hypothetical protein
MDREELSMKAKISLKDRIYTLIALLIYFAGFYLIYYHVGKWVAIGAALMVLSVYFGIQSSQVWFSKKKEDEEEK